MTTAVQDRPAIPLPPAPSPAWARVRSWAVAAIALAALGFLCLPVLIVVPMSFSGASSLQFPPTDLSLRWYAQVFADAIWVQALQNSLLLATASSTAALLLGGLAAYGLTRGRLAGAGWMQSNFIAPLIIPSVVLAVALYLALARVGLLGSWTGLMLGHTLLGVPYVVLILTGAIRSFDLRIEQAAFTLGASGRTMAMRVLLPILLPSVAAAWIFAFVTSFDEVVLTAFIGGTIETVPKRMFNELALQVSPAITAIATLLIAGTLALMGLAALLLRRGGRASARTR